MNIELLRKIAAVIQENPRQFSIRDWHTAKGLGPFGKLNTIPEKKRVACGTTHCIAGWAQVLSSKSSHSGWAKEVAMEKLGLNEDEANRLFYADNWPRGFGGNNTNAVKTAARIEHFIATEGRE